MASRSDFTTWSSCRHAFIKIVFTMSLRVVRCKRQVFLTLTVGFFVLFVIAIGVFLPSCCSNTSESHQSQSHEKEIEVYAGCLDNEGRCAALKASLDNAPQVLFVGNGRYDNSRLLRIYDFHYTGSEWETLTSRYDICFATQSSIERIYWLPEILQKWTAPCHPGFRSQVSLHVAVPASISTPFTLGDEMLSQWKLNASISEIYGKGEQCPEAKDYLKFLMNTFPTLDSDTLKLKEVYPQNHMRNIARKACGVQWTYSADIDIIPRDGMADMLQEFYEKRKDILCDKCAFVIPTFEMNETFPFPESKQDVVKLYKRGDARQFHGKYFAQGHKATDYKRWTSSKLEESEVEVSHQILDKQTFMYEPFYISPDEIVPYDERFLGYGFTRNSQFKAALEAGWNFSVLTPVFSIHWGLQTDKTVLSPKKDGVGRNVRKEQTDSNKELYKRVVEELQLKHKLNLF